MTEKWDNVEAAFKELDAKEYSFFANSLSAYLKSLMDQGFTRREAMRLVESYSRFIYDLSIEEFLHQKHDELDEDEDE